MVLAVGRPGALQPAQGQPELRHRHRGGRRRRRAAGGVGDRSTRRTRRLPCTTTRWSRTRRSPCGRRIGLTLHDSTQGASPTRRGDRRAFGLEPAQVRVIAPHVGGGFGSKGTPRPHVVVAAMAARVARRPVKLAVTRQQMFAVTGYRTPTIQRLRLAADARWSADRDRPRRRRADVDGRRVRRADRRRRRA